MSEVKIGALCWNQYTDWPSLLEAGIRADRLGYSSLWTWDHLYPIVGDSHGPNYEGWLTLTAWAAASESGPFEATATELRVIAEDEAGRWHPRWQLPFGPNHRAP